MIYLVVLPRLAARETVRRLAGKLLSSFASIREALKGCHQYSGDSGEVWRTEGGPGLLDDEGNWEKFGRLVAEAQTFG